MKGCICFLQLDWNKTHNNKLMHWWIKLTTWSDRKMQWEGHIRSTRNKKSKYSNDSVSTARISISSKRRSRYWNRSNAKSSLGCRTNGRRRGAGKTLRKYWGEVRNRRRWGLRRRVPTSSKKLGRAVKNHLRLLRSEFCHSGQQSHLLIND